MSKTAQFADSDDFLLAPAKRYPLLTAEDEISIDGDKWSAVNELHKLFVEDEALRAYLCAFFTQALNNAPNIKHYSQREQHFTLRRELADYFSDGKYAEFVNRLVKSKAKGTAKWLANVADLNIPASLTVGIAVAALRRSGGQYSDSVADSIAVWERHWEPILSSITPETATRKAIKQQLTAYTRAKDKLVMHNLRLVYSIAGKYRGRGIAYADLVQEGTLGLIRAAEKYEAHQGYRFSTYCFNWISQAIRRYVGDVGAIVRFPNHLQEQIARFHGEIAQEVARSGEEPDDQTLADRLNISLSKARELRELRNLSVSLDAPKFDDEEGSLLDSVADETSSDTDANATQESLSKFLDSAMSRLESNEREVVYCRWGLKNHPVMTRTEIADKLGVSREWVRQLERSALNKLKSQPEVHATFEDFVLSEAG